MGVLTRAGGVRTAILVAVALLVCRSGVAQEPLEIEVKAAFIYNFTKFIDWPAGTPAGQEPFRLCVVSDEALQRSIQKTIAGETINGRPFASVVPRTAEEARKCQVLFVSRQDEVQATRMLSAVKDLPVLTVSDRAEFARRGGGIELVREDNRIRFDVNVPGAERGGIKLSSRLLRVARHVHESPKKK
jgi:hypothetical protein